MTSQSLSHDAEQLVAKKTSCHNKQLDIKQGSRGHNGNVMKKQDGTLVAEMKDIFHECQNVVERHLSRTVSGKISTKARHFIVPVVQSYEDFCATLLQPAEFAKEGFRDYCTLITH